MNIFTVVAALVLAAFALVTGVFGSSLDKEDDGFFRFVMYGLTAGSLWGAYCLSYPERHMGDVKYYGSHFWWIIGFVVASKAFLDVLLDGMKVEFDDVLEVVGICALVGSVGVKAKEIATPGTQPDLHSANIWLAVIGYVCLLVLVMMGAFKHRRAVALSVNAVRQGQMNAPAASQQPTSGNAQRDTNGPFLITEAQPPASGPNLKKNL